MQRWQPLEELQPVGRGHSQPLATLPLWKATVGNKHADRPPSLSPISYEDSLLARGKASPMMSPYRVKKDE